ncbi:YagK/YfjJ domain-containing protein [Vibrio bathopelagicus]|uniref:YagK/YfjJ domain-containing protein n=1 Tax=Vibrio bathopelagicus TaxID=2777577 RepID=UPI001CF599AE|nr:inovirus-type Gp2 protein [Vibrio bathopelagicus]
MEDKMMNNEAADLKRLDDGFYRGYQVDIDHGNLSLAALEILSRAYQNALMRFGCCYVFRFRLRIPEEQDEQEKTIINQWFYRLCHYRKDDNINVIWKREVSQTGCISYRMTLFLDASNCPLFTKEFKLRKRLTKDIKNSWAKTTGIHKHDINKLCLFLNHPLVELNKEHDDYRYQRGLLFYVLSRQARVNTTTHDEKNTLGSFISQSKKAKKKTSHNNTKESCDEQ